MAERINRVTQETVETNEPVVDNSVAASSRDNSVNKAAQIVWFVVGVLVFLLILRMVLSLLGANPANAFANLVYSLSNPFVSPFRGLLQVGTVELGVARFELETLVAIIVYTLIGWGIVKLISLGRRTAPPVA